MGCTAVVAWFAKASVFHSVKLCTFCERWIESHWSMVHQSLGDRNVLLQIPKLQRAGSLRRFMMHDSMLAVNNNGNCKSLTIKFRCIKSKASLMMYINSIRVIHSNIDIASIKWWQPSLYLKLKWWQCRWFNATGIVCI